MIAKHIRNVSPRQGYDFWSEQYDTMPNPVVALEGRVSQELLQPRPGEWILDAGCGTGRNLISTYEAGAIPFGFDFSLGMLRQARLKNTDLILAQADFHYPLPLASSSFNTALCALVGEHIRNIEKFFAEIRRVLKPNGRFVFKVYHPDLAQEGVEANFNHKGEEYRLGAVLYITDDYVQALQLAGFGNLQVANHEGDSALEAETGKPGALAGRRLLLSITAEPYIMK